MTAQQAASEKSRSEIQRDCPECGSTKICLVEQQLERIAKHLEEHTFGGIRDVHILIMKNYYQCHACRHKWDELSAD